jgi:GntR family transcriptional regulator
MTLSGPMYQRIADDLRRKIESGHTAPGSQLPTENDLMREYSASRNTVRDAIKQLTTRGLVETRAGMGTFVVSPVTPLVTSLTGDPSSGESVVYDAEVRAERREPSSSPPQVEIQQPDEQIARALHLAPGQEVVSRHQKRYIDGTPWSMQTSFYPMSLVTRGATVLLRTNNITEGAVGYLARELGIKQVGYQDQIKVRPPDEPEIAFFGLPPDGRISVFAILRTAFDQDGNPVRVTITVYPTDRNQFAVNVGQVPPTVSTSAGGDLDSGPAKT